MTASRLQTELAAELCALLVWTEPGGLRQQTCQSLTTRTHWFVVSWCAFSCQILDLAGDLLQYLADLGTVLARGYADGTDLSGGQWQRVALARALCAVRLGAGVVLLDEPTAQLDVRGEAEIFDRILSATRRCT